MTEIGAEDDGTKAIVISSEIESAAEQEEFQGLNVCRSAALSTLFGRDSIAVQQLAPEMRAMGFSEQLSSGAVDWPDITPEDLIPDGGSHQEAYRDGGIPDRVQLWQILNDTGSSRAAYPFLIAVLGSPLERESVAAAATLWRQLSKFQGSQTLDPGALFMLHSVYASWDWGQGFTPWLSVEPYTDDLHVIPWNPQQWEDSYRKVMDQWRPAGENPKVWQGVFVLCRLAQLRLEIALRSQDVVTR
ncbi:hypothetical protein ACFY0G_44735 [Streptomyces sp. NPDC001552]|uniref:hypothetical protein n=1 Tax=Streptomyces sp. NPDC001552 TaxID=3364587 RepID=UPI00368EB387